MTLTLRFTRLSPTHHRFEYRRADGTGEAVDTETEGQLRHDLMHYVVEREARLRGSFYGILDKIGGYEELSVAGGAALGGEVALTERVVAALTDALADETFDDTALVAQVAEFLEIYDEPPPRWFNRALVLAAIAAVRDLEARWEATGVGEELELTLEL
ncbi:MAG TPA: hypothetical protein VGL58_01190 [Caulobacteraceae bacterium]